MWLWGEEVAICETRDNIDDFILQIATSSPLVTLIETVILSEAKDLLITVTHAMKNLCYTESAFNFVYHLYS
jgi:hypothetical protein